MHKKVSVAKAIGIVAVVFLLLAATVASAAPVKKADNMATTEILVKGAKPGYVPTEIEGRPVIFIKQVSMGGNYLAVSLTALGKVGLMRETTEPFMHDISFEARLAGSDEIIGTSTEIQPFFSVGEYSCFVPLTRELSTEEMQRLYVILRVDGKDECQRALIESTSSDPLSPTLQFMWDLDGYTIKKLTFLLPETVTDQDYFCPYVMQLSVTTEDGSQVLAENQRFLIWYKKGSYQYPEIQLTGDMASPTDSMVWVNELY